VQIEKNGILENGFLCTFPENETTWITSLPIPITGHVRMRVKASATSRSLTPVWDIADLSLTSVDKTSEITVVSPDSLFSLTVRPGTLYRPAPVIVDTVTVTPSNGLHPVSRGYRVVWGDEPLKNSCGITLELERDPPDKAAFFSSGNNNGWNFLSGDHEGRIFSGNIGGSNLVAVFRDTTSPYVAPVAPGPGSIIKSRRPLLKAIVEDKGSGIEGSDSIVMSVDGIPIYPEYDFEGNMVKYHVHNPLKTGAHTVTITATDQLGNARTRKWNFTIR